jgi:hypothetical protein
MKRLAYASLAVLFLAYSFTSFSADPSDRPAGVRAEDWVPVSDRLGIVLAPLRQTRVPLAAQVSPTALLYVPNEPTAGGYFMVKGANGWARLVVEPTLAEEMRR